VSLDDHDRRRAPRRRKLLRLTYRYANKDVTCIATDINHLGLFVNSQVLPPVGLELDFTYVEERSGRTIILRTTVVRVVHQTLRASRIPGMALEFSEILAPAGQPDMEWFLQEVLTIRPADLIQLEYIEGPDGTCGVRPPRLHTNARAVHEERLREGKHTLSEHKESSEMEKLHVRERRRNPRFPVHVDVSFFVGDIPFLGSVLNISQSSLFMQTDHEIPAVGTNISMKYPLAEAPDPQYVRIDATVCRHWNPSGEGLPGYAVHFDHVGELGRRGIFQMYLNSFRKRMGGPRRGYHYGRGQ
jgi:hypothetical protein